TCQPVIVVEVLESRLALSGATPEDVAQHLRRIGYEPFEINRFGTRAIESATPSIPRQGDWVAIPRSEHRLIELINGALRRCGLMPMVRGLNPLCSAPLSSE